MDWNLRTIEFSSSVLAVVSDFESGLAQYNPKKLGRVLGESKRGKIPGNEGGEAYCGMMGSGVEI